MTTCARGCCWTPWQACAQQRTCACHWTDNNPAHWHTGDSSPHRDPTAQQAIRNVMKEGRQPK